MFKKINDFITRDRWQEFLLNRFSGRENLSKEEAYQRFWSDLPEESVLEFFAVLESGLFLPGVLRPEDDIGKLTEPDKPDRWYKPLRHEIRFGDLQYELATGLKRQAKKHQAPDKLDWSRLLTIGDLVRVWCGRDLKV